MHYFLIVYLFSTTSVFVTEFNSLKECRKAKSIMMKELKGSKDLDEITCEKGYILDEYEEK